jgi:hypothetical protein
MRHVPRNRGIILVNWLRENDVGDMRRHIEQYADTMDGHSRIAASDWLTEQLLELDKFIVKLERLSIDGISEYELDRTALQVLLDRVNVVK